MTQWPIRIKGIECDFHIGCYEEERSRAQKLSFEIDVNFDIKKASVSDNIEDTVNYVGIINIVEKLSKQGSWSLVEKLSRDIGLAILEQYPEVESVWINLHKFIKECKGGVVCSQEVTRHG